MVLGRSSARPPVECENVKVDGMIISLEANKSIEGSILNRDKDIIGIQLFYGLSCERPLPDAP